MRIGQSDTALSGSETARGSVFSRQHSCLEGWKLLHLCAVRIQNLTVSNFYTGGEHETIHSTFILRSLLRLSSLESL